MSSFIPEWPKALDNMPDFENSKTPVSAQWFNQAQVLLEVIQGELGTTLSTTPVNSLQRTLEILTYNSDGGISGAGKVKQLKRVQTTMSETAWGAGTNTVTFNEINPEDVLPGDAAPIFGTVETTLSAGGMINGYPDGGDFSSGRDDVYTVRGANGSTGLMSGGADVLGDFLYMGLATFQ